MKNMKILNGKRYYERQDVTKYCKTACHCLVDPTLIEQKGEKYFDFPTDFLYSADSEEHDIIKQGINKLNNTLSWEFSSETALNFESIEKLYQSLKIPASNKVDNKSFKQTSPNNITSTLLGKYENWLNGIGIDILFSFFSS